MFSINIGLRLCPQWDTFAIPVNGNLSYYLNEYDFGKSVNNR